MANPLISNIQETQERPNSVVLCVSSLMSIWQNNEVEGNVLEGTESRVTCLQSDHWDPR